MNKAIAHRGPDDSGSHVSKRLSLGQVRLSILDLSKAGKQPMWYTHKSKKICTVFNGEIYNYIEIKEELVDKGYRFVSQTDTEVILASYLEWGHACVDKFNGMWSFCIYDQEKQQLFLSRDRLGQKPLYYYHKDNKFIFSSELKAILQHKKLGIHTIKNIDKEAVQLYFALGYIPAPWSIFKDVTKLESAHNLIYDLKEKKIQRKWQYYHLPRYEPIKNYSMLRKQVNDVLQDSVRLRMRSDVPVGAFLSGGLDSSGIVAQMSKLTKSSKLHTFSIGFKDKSLDESRFIKIAAKHFHTQHHHYTYTSKDFEHIQKEFAKTFDEPFGDFAGFPQLQLSKEAKKTVTVALSGDGGDEVFGGYQSHITGHRLDLLSRVPRPIRKAIVTLRKPSLFKMRGWQALLEAMRLSLLPKERLFVESFKESRYIPDVYKKWTTQKLKSSLKLTNNTMGEALRIYDLLYNTLPDHFNQKVDRTSMKHGLEVRSPFMDYRLVNLSQSIPAYKKANIVGFKIILKDLLRPVLPSQIIKRKKQGFVPPWKHYAQNTALQDTTRDFIRSIDQKILEVGSYSDVLKLRLVTFDLWFQTWINKK